MYPDNYLFTREHEWIKLEGDEAIVGISDFAQHQLGDIIYVELPRVGVVLEVRQKIGTIESVKAVSDVYSPVSGEIIAVNELLGQTPEVINKDPHNQGWIVRVKLADRKNLASLMSATEYEKYLEGLEG